MAAAGEPVTVETVPEKPVAGGRMLARSEGRILLVQGALPGERVRVQVERRARGVTFGRVVEVLEPHAGRRPPPVDPDCGGNALAHATYPTQLTLKSQIVGDAFQRIAGLSPPEPVAVEPSPETGYRMRARLHVQPDAVGFHRAGSHGICDARSSGQLLPASLDAVEALIDRFRSEGLAGASDLPSEVLLAENVLADARVAHLEWTGGAGPAGVSGLPPVPGLTGVSYRGAAPEEIRVAVGDPWVEEPCTVRSGGGVPTTIVLRRRAPSFFQGNRHLLGTFLQRVVDLVPPGPVLDLYAGVGLFGIALAAVRGGPVEMVEGDAVAGADLAENARPYGSACAVHATSVERFVESLETWAWPTVILDPPRTGLSRRVADALGQWRPHRLVYVSCDVPTQARDVKAFVGRGYELVHLEALDLFPNTAHIETVAVLEQPTSGAAR